MKRHFVGGIAAAVLATAATLSLVSIAVAKPGQNAKSDIIGGSALCGGALSASPVIGFANFHRPAANTVTVNYHLHGAQPNTKYGVYLFVESSCTSQFFIGSLTTNGNGVGNVAGGGTVAPASTTFFAADFPEGGSPDETGAVTLNP